MNDDFTFHILGRLIAADCHVLSVTGTERANAPYRFDVRVALAPNEDVLNDPKVLEGRALLEIPMEGGATRAVHGVVQEVSVEPGHYQNRPIVRFRLGPRFELLKLRKYSQRKSRPPRSDYRRLVSRTRVPMMWSKLARTDGATSGR